MNKNSGYILATKTLRTNRIVRIINHKTHIKRTNNTLYKRLYECKRRVRIVETFEAIEKYKEEIECLILIDDYVGSGDTLLGCINLIEEKGIKKEIIKSITLVVQKSGKEAIEKYGVDLYSAIIRNKAITDNYNKEDAEKKIQQMEGISKKLKVKNKSLYLGYKKSEGLVTMIKTPNNTFPFYWYEGKRDGKFMMAPFPRRNNVGVDE